MGGYNSNTIYQTTDGGDSWSNISSGLPNIPANTIVQDTSSSELNLFIGTDFGVYLKRASNSWQFFNTGLPKVVVDELDIYYNSDRSKNKLRAATYGRGLWESDLYFPQEAPIADFEADRTTIVEGNTINFTDLSTNAPSSWEWEFEGGDPSTSNNKNPSVTYNSAGLYKVKLTVRNDVGSDEETKIDYIDVQVEGAVPTVIFSESDTVICVKDTILFTDHSTEDPISWLWKISPSNGIIFVNSTSKYSQNPEILFSKPGIYSVQLTASNISGSGDSLKQNYITVNNIPDFPVFINPKTSVCKNSEEIFTVIQEDTNIYHWTLPSGWIGSSSTNSIEITNNGTNGNLYVASENKCGIGLKKKLEISIVEEKPNQPSSISGPNPVCENTIVNYSVINVPNVAYYWDLPSGWTANNSHENNIEVNTNTKGGIITLTPINACGVGISRILNVSTNKPIGSVSSIEGETAICEGTNHVYSISAENATIYNWQLPSNWDGNSVFKSISTTAGKESGTVQVTPENACGIAETQRLDITVTPLPISNFNYSTEENKVSFSNQSEYADSYYWSFGDNENSTEINPTHEYEHSGNYEVTLTAKNNCAERKYYANINISILNTNQIETSNINLYPNPSTGLIKIEGLKQEADIKVINTIGELILTKHVKGNLIEDIDISKFAEGFYQILIVTDNKLYKQTIILKK
jgi:PKD repeat protein